MVLNNGFKLGPDLLGYLDGNLSGYGRDDPQLAVEDFHLPWWRGSSAPQKYTSYLSFVSVWACLEEHRKQLVNAVLKNLGKQPVEETKQLNKPAYSWQVIDCTRCRLYRAVALGAADHIRDMRNMAHA